MSDLITDELSPESHNNWLGAHDLLMENEMLRRAIWEHIVAFDNEKEIIKLDMSDKLHETLRNLRQIFRRKT